MASHSVQEAWHRYQEPGRYRVVVYAESESGLEAQPEAITLQVGQVSVYLPLVLR